MRPGSPRSRPPRVSRWSCSWSAPSDPEVEGCEVVMGSFRELARGCVPRTATAAARWTPIASLESKVEARPETGSLRRARDRLRPAGTDHFRPVHVPAGTVRPEPVVEAPAHGQRRGPRRTWHPGRGPASLHRRAPMGVGPRRRLPTTPTSTGCSATPSSSSGATARPSVFERIFDIRPTPRPTPGSATPSSFTATSRARSLRSERPRRRRRSGGRRLGGAHIASSTSAPARSRGDEVVPARPGGRPQLDGRRGRPRGDRVGLPDLEAAAAAYERLAARYHRPTTSPFSATLHGGGRP